jgi:septal ring factor EnvC (AmiA/AmiB activator)
MCLTSRNPSCSPERRIIVTTFARSRTFETCKNYADEVRLVLPSLMDRERLEETVSKLSLYLAACSRLAQQMETLLETMNKTVELQSESLKSKEEITSHLKELLNCEKMTNRNTLETCRRLINERDESRREICDLLCDHPNATPRSYAKHRGWDCFEEGN